MSFIINQNFDLKSPQFNFARDYFANVASLKAASENDFPDHFITNVAGVLYQLTKSNSVDTTTGKWRKIKLGSDVDLSGYATTAELNKKAAKSEAIGKLDIGTYKDKLIIGGQYVDGTYVSGKNIPLASYSVTSDEENTQKAGLVTGAERKRLLALGLSGNSFNDTVNNTKGLRLSLNGTNSSVDISIAKPGDDSTYGLMSGADKKKLDGIAEGANKYTLPKASSNLGGIKIGYSDTTSGTRNYGVQLDSDGKAYVNVPWVNTDTKYSLPTATKDVLGGIKVGFPNNYAAHDYGLALGIDSKAFVNIPLATYNILNDTGQKDGLITGAERKAINSLSLSGNSLADNGGLQLILNGVIGDNNGSVVIPFATQGMNADSYGLMMGSDKNKLDGITSITKSEIDNLFN